MGNDSQRENHFTPGLMNNVAPADPFVSEEERKRHIIKQGSREGVAKLIKDHGKAIAAAIVAWDNKQIYVEVSKQIEMHGLMLSNAIEAASHSTNRNNVESLQEAILDFLAVVHTVRIKEVQESLLSLFVVVRQARFIV